MSWRFLCLLLLGGCGLPRGLTGDPPQAALPLEVIHISAAASTVDAVQELADLFEMEEGVEIRVNAGASSSLANQIIAGAPADLYLSASRRWADTVQRADLAAESVALLTNRLVIVVPVSHSADWSEPGHLLDPSIDRVALAGENVPAGMYAEQALKSLQLYDELLRQNKIVRGHDVRITLGYVERGEADAALVYATDASITDRVRIAVTLDRSTHEDIVYPLVLLRTADTKIPVRRFFEFLQSPTAESVFARYGFTPLANLADPETPATLSESDS